MTATVEVLSAQRADLGETVVSHVICKIVQDVAQPRATGKRTAAAAGLCELRLVSPLADEMAAMVGQSFRLELTPCD
jgi:hypothetical protein